MLLYKGFFVKQKMFAKVDSIIYFEMVIQPLDIPFGIELLNYLFLFRSGSLDPGHSTKLLMVFFSAI